MCLECWFAQIAEANGSGHSRAFASCILLECAKRGQALKWLVLVSYKRLGASAAAHSSLSLVSSSLVSFPPALYKIKDPPN